MEVKKSFIYLFIFIVLSVFVYSIADSVSIGYINSNYAKIGTVNGNLSKIEGRISSINSTLVVVISDYIPNNQTATNDSMKSYVDGNMSKVEGRVTSINLTTENIVNVYIPGNLTTTFYNATQTNTVTGTSSGGLGYVGHTDGGYDKLTMNLTEQATSPALDVRYNFTDMVAFIDLLVRYNTSNLFGDYPTIQLWDYTNSVWEDYGTLGESNDKYTVVEPPVFDSSNHISGGVVQMRFYKSSTGNINNQYFIDWISLVNGPGVPFPIEQDPLSIHRDGNLQLTGDWNTGSYDIVGQSFNGSWNGSGRYYLKSEVDTLIKNNATDNNNSIISYADRTFQKNISAQTCAGSNKFSAFANGTFTCSADVTGSGSGVGLWTATLGIWMKPNATAGGLYDITIDELNATAGNFSGNVVAGGFVGGLTGDVTGNADTATALAANGANCAAGSYPLGVDDSGAVEDCTDATTEIDSAIATSKAAIEVEIDANITRIDGNLSKMEINTATLNGTFSLYVLTTALNALGFYNNIANITGLGFNITTDLDNRYSTGSHTINCTAYGSCGPIFYDSDLSPFGFFNSILNFTDTIADQNLCYYNSTNSTIICDTPKSTFTYTGGDAITITANDIDFDGGATPSGDLGGTWATPSVNDDSHNHVYSNIDAFTEANLYTILSDVTQFWENGDAVTGAIGADEVYGSGWNGDTSVPEKDDIYDYFGESVTKNNTDTTFVNTNITTTFSAAQLQITNNCIGLPGGGQDCFY